MQLRTIFDTLGSLQTLRVSLNFQREDQGEDRDNALKSATGTH